MKYFLSAFIALTMAIGLVGWSWNFPKPNDLVGPVVKIEDDYGHGSGVFIAPNVVLTAAHVVQGVDPNTVTVRMQDGEIFKVVSVASNPDTEKDIAYLIVDHDYKGWIPTISCEQQDRGTKLFNIGNHTYLEFAYTELLVTGAVTEEVNIKEKGMVIFQGLSVGGASGSPIFNSSGEVVGILVVSVIDWNLIEKGQGIRGKIVPLPELIDYDPTGFGGYTSIESSCEFVQESITL